MITRERALSPNEAEFEFYNQKLSGSLQMQLCLRISGPLNFNIVRQAVRLLQSEHTLLQARIADSDGQLHYEVDSALEIPVREIARVSRSGEPQWRAMIEEELNAPLDTKAGLMRVTYVPAGAGPDEFHEIIIKAHHGIMDAASMMRVYGMFLSYCGQLAAGQSPNPGTSRPISPPTTELLPLRGLGLRWRLFRFMGYMMWSMITKKPKPMPITDFAPIAEQHSSFVDVRLPADTLTALVERARAERSSVTAALAAAMLLSTRKFMDGDDALNLAWLSPLSYRNAIRSDFADPANLAFAFGTGIFVNRVDPAGKFWDLARATKNKIEHAVKSRLHFCTPHMADFRLNFFKKEKPPAMVLSFSNMGAFDVPEKFGPLTLEEIQFTPALRGFGPLWGVHAYTYRGELYIHLGFAQPLLKPELARQWLASVVELLKASLAT